MEHRDIRERLGAYVLQALEPEERRSVEQHLGSCQHCRDEVARLSSLPGLLDRLDESDLAVAAAAPPTAESVLRGRVAARRAARRRLRGWQAATALTAAAAVAAVAVAVSGSSGPGEIPSRPLAITAADAGAATTSGEAAALQWEWGTTVSLDLADLPVREGYVVWVVATDGRREQAGTWGPTASHGATVRSASRIPTDEIARVEITDLDGGLLLVLRPEPEDA